MRNTFIALGMYLLIGCVTAGGGHLDDESGSASLFQEISLGISLNPQSGTPEISTTWQTVGSDAVAFNGGWDVYLPTISAGTVLGDTTTFLTDGGPFGMRVLVSLMYVDATGVGFIASVMSNGTGSLQHIVIPTSGFVVGSNQTLKVRWVTQESGVVIGAMATIYPVTL